MLISAIFRPMLRSPFGLGFAVAVAAWLVGTALQIWLIPAFYTGQEAVGGLVVLDSIGFHQTALTLAQKIHTDGWGVWRLAPNATDAPAGLAGAMYVLFGATPLSMLPLNAVLHGASATVVMLILKKIFTTIPAAVGAIAFAINPTALEWVAQIHRDGVFIFGNLLFVLGTLNLFATQTANQNYHFTDLLVRSFIPTVLGIFLSWLVRSYWVYVILVIYLTITAAALIALLKIDVRSIGKDITYRAIFTFFSFLFIFWLFQSHTRYAGAELSLPITPVSVESASNKDTTANTPVSFDSDINESVSTKETKAMLAWQNSGWLPSSIERRLYGLHVVRYGVLISGGNSLVDADYQFNSLEALLAYMPRALQLGLLSPSPDFWGGVGSTPAMSLARKLIGPLTVVFYICLFGSLLGLFLMRRNSAAWILVAACLISIQFYALVYPNIGALIRFRYGPFMLLISFGVATYAHLITSWHQNRAKQQN
jgi:hypothetical protein